MTNLAPVVLFVYNRPEHTEKTLQALQKNTLACESELYIFADAPKDNTAIENVSEVRKIIDKVDGFKKVIIIKQKTNLGLAASIISGVTEIINKHGKVIVLEDDLVTSPNFLNFMNNALDKYKQEEKVWHISGWNYPIEVNVPEDTYLWRAMNCWGWATWSNRWQAFEKNTDKIIDTFSKEDIKAFDLDGSTRFWGQILANKKGKINTWAIYWYATIFKKKGLCLNPKVTFVENIGLDGSGEHCSNSRDYCAKLNMKSEISFVSQLKESEEAVESIKLFYKRMKESFWTRLFNKISKLTKKSIK